MIKKIALVTLACAILLFLNNFASETVKEVLSSIRDDGILVKKSGIYTLTVEVPFWSKVKYTFLGHNHITDLLSTIAQKAKSCTDISALMGKPAVLVTKEEEAQQIRRSLEDEGYVVAMQEMAVQLKN